MTNFPLRFRAYHPREGMTHIDDLYWFEESGVHSRDDSDGWALMASTGLTDDNGKPVYEGDIVQFSNVDKYGTSWIEPSHHIVWFDPPLFRAGDRPLQGRTCRVIGNVYENPELCNSSPN